MKFGPNGICVSLNYGQNSLFRATRIPPPAFLRASAIRPDPRTSGISLFPDAPGSGCHARITRKYHQRTACRTVRREQHDRPRLDRTRRHHMQDATSPTSKLIYITDEHGTGEWAAGSDGGGRFRRRIWRPSWRPGRPRWLKMMICLPGRGPRPADALVEMSLGSGVPSTIRRRSSMVIRPSPRRRARASRTWRSMVAPVHPIDSVGLATSASKSRNRRPV